MTARSVRAVVLGAGRSLSQWCSGAVVLGRRAAQEPVGEQVAPLAGRPAAVDLAIGLAGVLDPEVAVERTVQDEPRRLPDQRPGRVGDVAVDRCRGTVARRVDDVVHAPDAELAKATEQIANVKVLGKMNGAFSSAVVR